MTGGLAHRFSAGLIWAGALCASLAAHAAAALWLTQSEPAQREGDIAAPPVIEVAYVPAPKPLDAPALAEPTAPPAPEPAQLEPQDTELPQPDPAATHPTEVPALAPQGAAPSSEKPQADQPPAPPPAKPKAKQKAKTPEPKPKPKQTAKTDAPAKKPKAAAPAPAAPAAKPKAGSAAGNRNWAAKIRSRIERKKSYPTAAKGASGVVKVHIRVAASGVLTSAKVTGSSGNAALDAAALASVKRAAPFPPAPAGSEGAEFSLNMEFRKK